MMIDGVIVEADCSIPEEIVLQEVAQERVNWLAESKPLALIRMTVDNDEVVVEAFEKSPIRRIRRITGYLSQIDSFNDAKKAELDKRVSHVTT